MWEQWLSGLRSMFGGVAPAAPSYASNFGGTFVQRGISVITAPFAPPVLDPGQSGYYNGSWFSAPFAAPAPLVLDPGQSVFSGGSLYNTPFAPQAPTVLNGGQSLWTGIGLVTAPVLAALNNVINPPAAAPAATPAAPSAPASPSCNNGNYSCIRYACAPGNYSCARNVAPWVGGGRIW